jgi:hypothetical protein
MSKTFLSITFNFEGREAPKALEKKINKALDWMSYAPNCWLVWTTSDPAKWYDRIKPVLRPGDHVFIVEIDINNRAGWLPGWIWEWIKKDRGESG